MSDERDVLIRQARQRLESLARAGLDRIPAPVPAPAAEQATRADTGGHGRARATHAAASKPSRLERPRTEPTEPTPNDARPSSEATLDLEPTRIEPPRHESPKHAPARPAEPASLLATLFDGPPSEPPLSLEERVARLHTLQGEVAACRLCPQLAATRTQTVFGEGSPTARLMFIGEAPGADEDRTGRPFVGRAASYLPI